MYLYLQSLKEKIYERKGMLKYVHRNGDADSFDVKNPSKRKYVCEFISRMKI